MPSYEFVTVDVFTEERFGGNPLAVFPHAQGLSDAQMQALAREFNLSETTFVLPPDDPAHTARVRIFTPGGEIPFAGHPNVGTGYVLASRQAERPEHYTFEEKAGLVRVHIQTGTDGQPSGARILAPVALQIGDAVDVDVAAACARLRPEDIRTDSHDPLMASVGTWFAIAEVTDVATLSRAGADIAAFEKAGAHAAEGRFSLLCYARLDGDATRLRSRMFAPLMGVIEDPATGSANAALSALLTSLAPGDNVELAFDIEQGVEMGRPSRILGTASKTAEGPVLASVAGSCVKVLRGFVDL